MKILIIAPFFPPVNTVASLRPYSWAKYWSIAGHDVTVITTLQPDNKWNTLELDASLFKVIQIKSDLFLWQKVKDFIKSKILRRSTVGLFPISSGIIDRWILSAYNRVKFENWDLLISTFSPPSAHLLGYLLKKRGGVKHWVADYRDLWSLNPYREESFLSSIINEFLERRINQTADYLTTVSEALAIKLSEKYCLKTVHSIANGFDFNDLERLDPTPLWNDGKIRIVYTGTIYPKTRDPSPLFEAINNLIKASTGNLILNIEVIFAGVPNPYLINLIEKFNLGAHTTIVGLVTRDIALKMQRDASVLLFLSSDAPGMEGILTGKVFEYLASETPILALGVSPESSVGIIIEQSGCGKALSNDINAIECFLREVLLKGAPKVNSEYAKKFDRKVLANKILTILEE